MEALEYFREKSIRRSRRQILKYIVLLVLAADLATVIYLVLFR